MLYYEDMANHKVVRGEESTYRANGGKVTIPYEGKHRKENQHEGHKLGDPKRIQSGGTDYDRDK